MKGKKKSIVDNDAEQYMLDKTRLKKPWTE